MGQENLSSTQLTVAKKGEPWKLGLSRYSEMLAVGAIVVYFQSRPNFYTEDASRAGIRSASGLRPEGSIALLCVGGWSRPCRPCDPGRACRRSILIGTRKRRKFGVRFLKVATAGVPQLFPEVSGVLRVFGIEIDFAGFRRHFKQRATAAPA
jgi:hypothetical protein